MGQLKRLINNCLSLIRWAIERYQFLSKNSRAVVAVSGGVDSLLLLFLLNEYNRRFNQKWEIYPCHINPGFPNWNAEIIQNYAQKMGLSCKVIDTDISKRVKDSPKRCFLCARERRKKLLEYADSLNIFQIALAHHLEDAAETLIMNILYNGEISTILPKQPVIAGRFFFIRPIYYVAKKKIIELARLLNLPENMNICPYYSFSKREKIRRFIQEIEKEYPDIYQTIFSGIFNIRREYLP